MLLFRTLISFLKNKEYQDLLITTAFVIGVGATAYHFLEGWSWIESVYVSVVTLTTVGYGDFTPQTDAGKIFTVFYIFIGIGIILSFVNTVYNHFEEVKKEEKAQNREKASKRRKRKKRT